MKANQTIFKSFIFFSIIFFFSLIISIDSFSQSPKRLRQLKIKSIDLYLDSSYLRLPGYTFPIAIKVVAADGYSYFSKGLGGGQLRWNNFNVTLKGGVFSNGKVLISNKLFPGDFIEIEAQCIDFPGIQIKKIVKLNYVDKLSMFTPNVSQKIPGARFNIGLNLHYDNGCKETVTSWNSNSKLINALKFQFSSSGGTVKQNRFSIYADIDQIQNHFVWLKGEAPRFPYANDSIGFLLDYIGDFQFYTAGFDGLSGFSGSNGSNGFPGSESSNGQEGQQGENGRDGQHGDNGRDLTVFCNVYFDSILNTSLLYVEVNEIHNQNVSKYLVNPDGGTLHIVSKGGDGGKGGNGGDGGNGGNGGDGRKYTIEVKDTSGVKVIVCYEKGGNGGSGGAGGNGGYGGEGGRGGDISIYYTASAKPFLGVIKVESIPGNGGFGGSSGKGGKGGDAGSNGDSGGCNGPDGQSGENGFEGSYGRITWIEE